MTHPTHSFHAVGEEGVLCRDCDCRQTSTHASEVCPEFAHVAARIVREAAHALYLSLPTAPVTAGELVDPSAAECKAALQAGREWTFDAQLRETTCRALARLLGVDVDVDASLTQMSRA